MEAPERNKPLLLCQKCFAVIPHEAEYCAECGAPAVDDLSEGSDTAVYPELARANLLRMRGEYKVAEDICLAILRRHPNSATANTLLGDICAERGDLKQAAEWYEMALDITPDSASDRQKLDETRRRIREREAAETAKHLGLPESKPKVMLWVGGIIVFVAIVATLAYLLGERMTSRRGAESRQVTAPITVPLDTSRAGVPDEPRGVEQPLQEPASADLLQIVRTAIGADSGRLVSASRFPETLGVLLTFTVTGTEDSRRLAAVLGSQVLEKVADTPLLTAIVLRNGKVDYYGTITRERFQATQSETWKAQYGSDPAALADALLQDEWSPPTDAPPLPNAGSDGTQAPSGG